MTMVTVAVIGGGSSMFVPGLVRMMLELDAFEDAELRLMDIDSARLQVMSELATELASAEGRKLSVAATTNQREALHNVDFAIVAISVGGMAAWESDIEVPGKHGVFMHIADSIGPGGIFRALRNMPVVASVARDLAEVSPRAMLFNYTNPASANAMAMADVSPVRSVSLCSCSPWPFQRAWLADLIGVDPEDVVMPIRVGGINHCTGILSLQLRDGSDAMPLVRSQGHHESGRMGDRYLRGNPLLLEPLDRVLPAAPEARGALQRPRPGPGHALWTTDLQHGPAAGPDAGLGGGGRPLVGRRRFTPAGRPAARARRRGHRGGRGDAVRHSGPS